MRSSLLITVAFSGLAAAAKCKVGGKKPEPHGHEWRAPGFGDSRSPCPMLNAMANHGWLPRDGKAITLPMVLTAFDDAMGFDQDVFVNITEAALAVSTTGNPSTFNLQDTAHHDAIEHDGSLSRNDIFFGNNLQFNPVIWKATAARYGIGMGGPKDRSAITVEVAARARAARVEDAKGVNPTFNLTNTGLANSYGETSVLLAAFWNEESGGAPKEWIRVLFEEERIAYREGFKKLHRSLSDVVDMLKAVEAVPV